MQAVSLEDPWSRSHGLCEAQTPQSDRSHGPVGNGQQYAKIGEKSMANRGLYK